MIARVSGERIRHELFLLFQEPKPEDGLARLEQLQVLRQIHPGLRCDGWLQAKFRTLREVLGEWYDQSWLPDVDEEDHDALHGMPALANNAHQLYLALLCFRLLLPEVDTLATRLKLVRQDVELLHKVAELQREAERLQVSDVCPSEVYHLFAPYTGPMLLVFWVATDSAGVRAHLTRYWQEYRHVKPILSGDDLKAMGGKPGRIFGTVLDSLRDAHLDGEISTEAEEREIARRMLGEANKEGVGEIKSGP